MIKILTGDPSEYIAYMAQAGKELGVKEFAPYPGDKAMLKFIRRNKGKNDALDVIVHFMKNTSEALKGLWDSLAGNYIMGLAGTVVGGATLYNMFNENSNDQDIH